MSVLIDAEQRSAIGRIEMQPDDVANFLDQQRIVRLLEGLTPMRLQAARAPDLLNRRAAQTARFPHLATAPSRRPSRRLFLGADNHSAIAGRDGMTMIGRELFHSNVAEMGVFGDRAQDGLVPLEYSAGMRPTKAMALGALGNQRASPSSAAMVSAVRSSTRK